MAKPFATFELGGAAIYGDYVEEDNPTPEAIREDLELLAQQAEATFKELPPFKNKVEIHWFVVIKEKR